MSTNAVRIEASARWVRAQLNGVFLADSKRPLLVWDSHHIPVYYFPLADVRLDLLQDTGRGHNGRSSYNAVVDGRTVNNAAWRYSQPDPDHAPLRDYIALRWERMDHWYEEDEEQFVHARDPYKRVDAMPSTRHIRVIVDDVTLAESSRPTLLFETGLPTRYYLPPQDVDARYLVPSELQTACPYKGTAGYYSIRIGDSLQKNLVWTYRDPIPEQPKIRGLLAFYNEKVDIYVDGELETRPVTQWS